jgi:hypothetical protein
MAYMTLEGKPQRDLKQRRETLLGKTREHLERVLGELDEIRRAAAAR